MTAMKKPNHLRLAFLGAVFFAGGLVPSAPAQAPAAPVTPVPAAPLPVPPLAPAPRAAAPAAPAAMSDADQAAIAQLVAEVAQQQAKLVENQKQIEARMVIIAENMRIARIYVSRGGGAGKKP